MRYQFVFEQKLKEISKILENEYKTIQEVGVISGISGIALFQFYYAKYVGSEKHSEIAREMITYALKKINTGYNYPSYCTGIAGLCWTIQHLETHNFIDVDTDEILASFDSFLYNQMYYDLDQQNFDFLHGALGYGFYFLNRYVCTSDLDLKKQYELYLLGLVSKLEDLAVITGTMFKWESTLNIITGAKGFDLSLSHGISGIINFLSRLCQFEVFKKSTEKLIRGGIAFLLSTESTKTANLSLFPAAIEKEKSGRYNSRVSWCYGDLGIGLTLLRVGSVLKDVSLQKKAYAIFKHTMKRRAVEETFVKDAGICHGSYGNALMYQSIFYETKTEDFKNMSQFWLEDGIQKAVHKDGYAGYKQWCNNQKDWVSELSLLEGIAGIGLTMINYLSKKHHKWDECLLIS